MIEKILEQVDETLDEMRLPYQLNWVEENKISARLEKLQSYSKNCWLGLLEAGLSQLTREMPNARSYSVYVLELNQLSRDVQRAKTQLEQSLRNLESYLATVPESSGIVLKKILAEEQANYLAEKSQDLVSRTRNLRMTLIGEGMRNISQEQLAQEFFYIARELSVVNHSLEEEYPTGMRKELVKAWNNLIDLIGPTIERIYCQEKSCRFMAYGQSYGMRTVVASKPAEAKVA